MLAHNSEAVGPADAMTRDSREPSPMPAPLSRIIAMRAVPPSSYFADDYLCESPRTLPWPRFRRQGSRRNPARASGQMAIDITFRQCYRRRMRLAWLLVMCCCPSDEEHRGVE